MQFAGNNPFLAKYMCYFPLGVKRLYVYKEKKPKQHYKKYYDLQVDLLGFQNLENSTIHIEKENMSTIVRVLLYDAIPSSEFEIFYIEIEWLKQNANDCK
jgi:hypothetical protein